jgi:RES domain-containing protein
MKSAVAQVHEWSGTLYRSAPPKWSAGRDMLAGVGSMKSGARFNAAEAFPPYTAAGRPNWR